MTEQDNNQVQLENTGQIELPKLELDQYIGQETNIESITEHKGKHGYYVRMTSEVVDTIGDGDDAIELRASKIFGLQEDSEGNIGWGESTKLGAFLKNKKANHYNDLQEASVIVTKRTTKKGQEFLTFE